jgi:hypothetical protein
MRPCSKCGIEKASTEFYVKDSKSGRLHAQCKLCYKEHRKTFYSQHYEKYGEVYRKRARAYRDKIKSEYRTMILSYMSDKSCVGCGESDIVVLELDHIDPTTKLFSVSQAVKLGYRGDAILDEIKKCQVLCANCHKRKTAKQFGWYKA